MKTLMAVACVLLSMQIATAQEFKLNKSSGKIRIVDINKVQIEGTSGNEIIFVSRDRNREDDERAKGLRAVSALGLEDNTGLGLSVIDKGDVVEVRQLKKMDGPSITIKVPKNVGIQYAHNSPYGSELSLRNLENDLEISVLHNSITLENVTGAVSIKTVHGNVDASFGDNVKSPINITSVHGHVDIRLPATTKANLRMKTSWGEIFIDPQLKIDVEKKGDMESYSDSFSGKLNGGGLDVNLASTHNNVYLRKK